MPGEEGVALISSMGARRCSYCAAIGKMTKGRQFFSHPSPGQMGEAKIAGPFSAIYVCFRLQPKKRIRIEEAKSEI